MYHDGALGPFGTPPRALAPSWSAVIYDAAVIGAGPAGAWTARLLASRGARVALVDPSHPREKPCGGGVTGRALALVASALDPLPRTVAIQSARFVDSSTGRSAAVALDDLAFPALSVASRAAFDLALVGAAERAGATLVASRATSIAREGARWRLSCGTDVHHAAFIVGADGANSFTRRIVSRPFARDQLSIATGFFAEGATSREIVIEFTAEPAGYIWSFPRPDHLAIGVCAQADAGTGSAVLRERVRRWIDAHGFARGTRLVPYSWPIPSLSAAELQRLEVEGPGWMLVGDAAGLVDPITREGIFFALQSAAFAADALSSGGRDASGHYREAVRTTIASELARAARLKAGFFRPRFIRLLVGALAESEGIRRVMADLASGEQSYRGLKWRLAGTFELRLALKALVGA
jgi:geranylgeranyl reductase family protein